MKQINIPENSSYTLGPEYTEDLNEFLNENKDLPLRLNGNTILFDDYTIGSLTIRDQTIVVIPRIQNLTPNHFFEMQLYNEGLLNNNISGLLGENSQFGIQQNVIQLFLDEALELVAQGVEGAFNRIEEETNIIKGRILIEKISPVNLLQDRIPIEFDVHTRQTSFNKIIKLALDKVRILIEGIEQKKMFALVNSYFDDIDTLVTDLPRLLQENESKLYYENDKYPVVIGLALKILKDLKLNMRNNEVLASSYLVNSNNLFENYVRKVLADKLKNSVSKWNSPKKIGQFSIGDNIFEKSYIPDIMLGYHKDTNNALAVLDAKNKDITNFQNIGSLADLYQILFYCYSLDTKSGGIVYPYFGSLNPVRLNIDSFKETNLFAFNIDFSLPLGKRNEVFVNDVKQTLSVN
ncbi:5-methylcytosine restriction system specificity protein McrC [Salipaludibacillus sp. HK11]|uniref:5-methylcytosine restriction system specificity protein McrC n=1 Tax=Salipaludibacillus sp. HK11 TaxID=3394320 RepID=UPI0039FC4C2B